MTTIACNKKQMVSDSKVSLAHKGFTYPAIKIVKAGKVLIGAAGDGGDCTRFLKWAENGFKGAEPKWGDTTTDDQIVGLVVRDEGIFIWSRGDPEPERIEADYFAVGSGGKAARAVMMMGGDPVKAVEIACLVDDLNSGPPLQILDL